MARARRTTTENGDGGQATADSFTCPECGKTFTRAASLGAHRQRAHGVSGASRRASERRATAAGGRSRRRSRGTPRAAAATASARPARGVDRDQLLRALFPNGVPPREDVIKRLGSWLDEAERLSRL